MDMTLLENTMIPIYKNPNHDLLVDARNLHAFLENKRQFADWIKQRIEDCDFSENQDYVPLHKFVKAQGAAFNRIDYALTFDAAKHIAMLERNAKGKQIRQYFIDFEKKNRERDHQRDFQKEKIIEAFIRELGPYAPMFPDNFYQALYPLMGWKYQGKNKQPGYIGKLTNRLIYTKLAPGVYEEIDKRNPYRSQQGRRRYIMSRLLTDEIGKAALRKQIDFVTQMASLVNSVEQLEQIVEKNYQNNFGEAQQLSFLKVHYELVAF